MPSCGLGAPTGAPRRGAGHARFRHPVQRAPRTGTVVSPGRCPEASRERGVTPARRRRPSPSLWHTSGRPPRLGDGRGQDSAGEEGRGQGADAIPAVMAALVATIHGLGGSERHAFVIGRRPPSAPQDVDARDEPYHDGEAREPRRLFLLPNGRRGPGGPDEGLPLLEKARRRRCAQANGGRPSPRPLSHPGEGFPAHCIRVRASLPESSHPGRSRRNGRPACSTS
jgi:hypothetical protein